MKKDDLEALPDTEIHQLIKDAQTLLASRDKAKKAKAIDDAKATLAAVGLTFRAVAGHSAKPATTKTGAPAEPRKRGRPPKAKPDTKTP